MDSFFGIGMFELVMIAIIALVVLGPERLPSAMREVAKWLKQLRQMSNEFQSQFSDELKILDELNPRRILNEALDPNAKPTQPPAPAPPVAPVATAAVPAVRAATPATPAKPPVVETVKVPIPNAETTNSILPPPVVEPLKDPIPNAETTNSIVPPPVLPVPIEVTAVADGPVEPPAVGDVAAQPTAQDNDGAEAVQ